MHSKGNRFAMVLSTHGRTLLYTHTYAYTYIPALAVTECLHDAEMREERKGWKKIRATRSLVNVPCRTVPYLATSYPFASFYRPCLRYFLPLPFYFYSIFLYIFLYIRISILSEKKLKNLNFQIETIFLSNK